MRARRIPSSALVLVVLASQSGCYNIYQPAVSPRIEIRSDNVLLKNGKVVKSLPEAMHENPVAEAEALRGTRARTVGNIVHIGGLSGALAAEIIGLALSGTRKGPPPAAIATFIAGGAGWLVTSIIGMGYLAKASKHERNAINMYNDGLPPCPPPAKRGCDAEIVR